MPDSATCAGSSCEAVLVEDRLGRPSRAACPAGRGPTRTRRTARAGAGGRRQVVGRRAVPDVHVLDDAELAQRLQRAVHRRPVHRRVLLRDGRHDLVGGQVRPGVRPARRSPHGAGRSSGRPGRAAGRPPARRRPRHRAVRHGPIARATIRTSIAVPASVCRDAPARRARPRPRAPTPAAVRPWAAPRRPAGRRRRARGCPGRARGPPAGRLAPAPATQRPTTPASCPCASCR